MLDDLNEMCICSFLSARLSDGLAPHTVAKERAQIVSLANDAARKRLVDEFVKIPSVSTPELTPEAYKTEQLTQLLDACQFSTGFIGNAPADVWWTALHYVFLFTGERTEATLSLRWDWLEWDTGWLQVPATVRKGKRKAKRYQLPSVAIAKLRLLRPYTEQMIFETHWKSHATGSFYYHYKKLLMRAGLPSGRKWKPQRLRRTFASYLEKEGGDATDALDHSSRRVTKQSYLDESICGKISPSQIVNQAYKLT